MKVRGSCEKLRNTQPLFCDQAWILVGGNTYKTTGGASLVRYSGALSWLGHTLMRLCYTWKSPSGGLETNKADNCYHLTIMAVH